MPDGFLVLIHFLNFTFGFTALVLISVKRNAVPVSVSKPFFNQALFYNLTIVFMTVVNFIVLISGGDTVRNRLQLGLYAFTLNLNNLFYVLWSLTFIVLVLRLTGEGLSAGMRRVIYGAAIIFSGLILFDLTEALRKENSLFRYIVSIILCYSPVVVLGFSAHLLKKSGQIAELKKRKALRSFGILFIIFPLLLFLYYSDSFFFHVLSARLNRLAINSVDFVYNAIIVYWSLIHLKSLAETKPKTSDITGNDLILKYQISKRECEIINLVCAGLSNQEIADELFISLGTVKNHLYNIYFKLGIKNRTQLVKMF